MRAALAVSALLHIVVIGLAIFGLPQADPYATEPVEALPVELVTIAEVTDLTAGEVQATEVLEEAAPETVVDEAPPEPEARPGATEKPAETTASDPEAIESTTESTAPEPAGEPDPPEPAEEPQPVEEAAAPAPEPTPEPPPEPPVEATPEPAVTPAPVAESVVPRRKPKPPKRQRVARLERQSEDAFDADRLSQLINRTAPTGGGEGAATASLGTQSGRPAAALTLSEMDALRAQMQRCWNPPIGLAGGEELVIAVQIRLTPDGGVESITEIGAVGVGPLYDVAADAARRAVIQCQPYKLPPQKYEVWKDVQVTFDPRELF